jgi:formylmethanofuran dehydrogenase subunit E
MEHSHKKSIPSTTAYPNIFKRGREPKDWWDEIERTHGHVGPWNVLGWRIGKAALREFETSWGRHEIDIICYVPLRTPYSCMVDGLVIGTGNAMGWLDVRLAEAISLSVVQVYVKRKDGTGPVLIFKPRSEFLKHIDAPKPEVLETLSRECSTMDESDLFDIQRVTTSS